MRIDEIAAYARGVGAAGEAVGGGEARVRIEPAIGVNAMCGGDDDVVGDQGAGAAFAAVEFKHADSAPRKLFRIDQSAVVAAEEVIVDAHWPFATMTIGAVGACGA